MVVALVPPTPAATPTPATPTTPAAQEAAVEEEGMVGSGQQPVFNLQAVVNEELLIDIFPFGYDGKINIISGVNEKNEDVSGNMTPQTNVETVKYTKHVGGTDTFILDIDPYPYGNHNSERITIIITVTATGPVVSSPLLLSYPPDDMGPPRLELLNVVHSSQSSERLYTWYKNNTQMESTMDPYLTLLPNQDEGEWYVELEITGDHADVGKSIRSPQEYTIKYPPM